MKRALILASIAAVLCMGMTASAADVPPDKQYTDLQTRAVSLMPIMEPKYIEAMTSTGVQPKTPTEIYIFKCIAPSEEFHTRREALPDKEYLDSFGDMAVELTQIYLQEDECLKVGAASGQIKFPRQT